ncbi:MAG TPA: hypothetical protein VIF34_07970 [Methylocystis sp.]|jgi:hypothetical protein
MKARVLASAVIATAFVQAAAAQSDPGQQWGGGSQQDQTSPRSLPMQIQQKLRSFGFSDVQVLPRGYVVTARDRDGDPVTMIIGPRSVAMFAMSPEGRMAGQESWGQGGWGTGGQGRWGGGEQGGQGRWGSSEQGGQGHWGSGEQGGQGQ